MHYYYVTFVVQREIGTSTHTREIEATLPIEYASDIKLLGDACAKLVGVEGKDVMVTNWVPLLGQIRPTSPE